MQMDIIFLKNQNTVDPAVIKKLNHVSVYVCEGEWLKYSSSNIQM